MKAGTFLFATLCAYVTCFSDVTAQGDILEVAASLGCNQFVEWVNSTGLIPDALVDEADSYTLFAVRDEDIPIQIERLFSFISPVLLGNYLSHSFANGSYEAADFENDKLVDTATLYPYFVKQLRMNVYEVNGNTMTTRTLMLMRMIPEQRLRTRIGAFKQKWMKTVLHKILPTYLFNKTTLVTVTTSILTHYLPLKNKTSKHYHWVKLTQESNLTILVTSTWMIMFIIPKHQLPNVLAMMTWIWSNILTKYFRTTTCLREKNATHTIHHKLHIPKLILQKQFGSQAVAKCCDVLEDRDKKFNPSVIRGIPTAF